MGDLMPLNEVPRRLREHGLEVGYHACWRAATDGHIPAEKVGARWLVRRSDLPAIVAAFAPTKA